MFTKVQIVNLGLSKIAASTISRIDPPQTSLERFVAGGFEHWKRSEIAKRRWVFATEDHYALAKAEEIEGAEKPYKYSLPVDCLRPIRGKYAEWKQRRRYIYSTQDNLRISYVVNVDESEFDPLFVEVLACRIALESVEFVTQSNTKKADAKALYDEAVIAAGKANSFIRGPEDVTDEDVEPFIRARY